MKKRGWKKLVITSHTAVEALTRIVAANLRKNFFCHRNYQSRLISTSKKNRETSSVVNPAATDETECQTPQKSKNWISYGFSLENESEDRFYMHAIMFAAVSLTFVFGGFLLAYRPKNLSHDWAQREAYLELRRREELGLPLVDPNYIPLDQLILPSDEELGDTEIVI